jgi:YHS domain-containing protein
MKLGFFAKSNKAQDPICLMKVEKKEGALKTTYKGEMYYFCSPGCQEEFEKDPQKYL